MIIGILLILSLMYYFMIIVGTQLLFIIMIPTSIFLIIFSIIARKPSAFIYTLLSIGFVILQRFYIEVRSCKENCGDGFSGFNLIDPTVLLIIDIAIIIFFALTIKSLTKSERLKELNKIIVFPINKNTNKVKEHQKKENIDPAFNIEHKSEENIEMLEETKKTEEESEEIEERTKIIIEAENNLNKKKKK